MNSKTLVDLPVEILFEIIKNLPNKREISLACKKLYGAAWKLDIANFQLKLNLVTKFEESRIESLLIFYFLFISEF